MENASFPFYFRLTMFVSIGQYRYPAFAFCLLLYGFIVSANLLIALVILRQRSLHEPMYVFVAFLCLNSLYGSAGFFPRFLQDLLSDSHLITRRGCFAQIYVIYTYACYELTILSVMAYDRYVAVCRPLHYHRHMNARRIAKLVALALTFPAFCLGTCILMSARLPLCSDDIRKVFCANWNVLKLSCVDTAINNVVGLIMTVVTAFLPLFYVLYTYLRIVIVCWKKSAEFKGRVLQNCLPHVVSFVIYSVTSFCDIALARVRLEEVNPVAAVMLSLEFVVIPPLLNPLVYGFKLPEIRKHILKLSQK